MNIIDLIKIEITKSINDSEIYIEDESKAHESHFNQLSHSIPSHLKIKVISDSFNGMSLITRHRQINDIMKDYFDKGLHSLKIIAKTKKEDSYE
jgi:BolA protein